MYMQICDPQSCLLYRQMGGQTHAFYTPTHLILSADTWSWFYPEASERLAKWDGSPLLHSSIPFPFRFPPLLFLFILGTPPLNQLRRFGKNCKLPQWVRGKPRSTNDLGHWTQQIRYDRILLCIFLGIIAVIRILIQMLHNLCWYYSITIEM